jgi:hypothetical protein
MLIPFKKPKEKTFVIEFARWKSIVNAEDPEEAATFAFEEVLEKYRDQTEVSSVFTVIDITSSLISMDMSDHTYFIYAPKVLANAGMHKTSMELKSIIDNLKIKQNEE